MDRLRGILHGGKGFIADIEAREKEKTGIKSLKVGYNKVFGYYIEVSKSYYDQVPEKMCIRDRPEVPQHRPVLPGQPGRLQPRSDGRSR